MTSKLHRALYDRSPVLLQNVFTSIYGYTLHRTRYGGDFKTYQQELEKSQWFSLEELQALQLETLQKLVQYAYDHVPFYRESFQAIDFHPNDLKTVDDLRALPLLGREDIFGQSKRMVSETIPSEQLRLHHTSGTTGTPLSFYEDLDTVRRHYAFWARFRGWFGYAPRKRRATLSGRIIVPRDQSVPPYWRTNLSENQLVMSSFHLSAATIPAYLEKLERFKPFLLDGYVATIYTLAKYINAHGGTSIRPQAIQTTSETLLAHHRKEIEQAFQCRVYDQYGHGEKAVFISECEHGTLHVSDEHGLVEIVNERGDAVGPNESGEVVVTGFNNWVMPLIRYRTGDLATAADQQPCGCGRGLSRIKSIEGRIIDILRMPDGRIVPPTALTLLFDKASALNIAEAQIDQQAENLIVIHIVPRTTVEDVQVASLEADLRSMMGQDVTIEYDFVDHIARTAAGKFKFVKSNVN